jgi:hypothetical protein
MKRQFRQVARLVYFLTVICFNNLLSYSQQEEIRSPDGKITVGFTGGEDRRISVKFDNRQAIIIDDPALIINGEKAGNASFSVQTKAVHRVQQPVIREKRAIVAIISMNCNIVQDRSG